MVAKSKSIITNLISWVSSWRNWKYMFINDYSIVSWMKQVSRGLSGMYDYYRTHIWSLLLVHLFE